MLRFLIAAALFVTPAFAHEDEDHHCVVGEQSCMAHPGSNEWKVWTCASKKDGRACYMEDQLNCEWVDGMCKPKG